MHTVEKDIEKEMENWKILTFADILRALKAHPDWLEEIRKVILTTELLELPRKFDQLAREFEDLKVKIDKIEKDTEHLKQDVAVLKQDVAVLKKDMAYVKGELGRFRGKEFERTIRERYYAYFGGILRKAKLIPFEEILHLIDEAEEKGLITEIERASILRLDLLVEGQIKSTKKDVILAVEVSYTLQKDGIERALERADKLHQILKTEIIPTVVVVESKEELNTMADERGILIIKSNYE